MIIFQSCKKLIGWSGASEASEASEAINLLYSGQILLYLVHCI
jgi:hypothetical protein